MSDNKPDWLIAFEAAEQRLRDRLPIAKAALLKALKSTRAATVTIDYDGEGDSGQITGITGRSAAGTTVKLGGSVTLDLHGQTQEFATLEEALDEFAWCVLGAYHGGFQNNEGGYGRLTIDVANETIELDHNDRFMDITRTLTEV